LQPAHAQRFHDLVGAVAGIDHDRILAAEDQEAEREDAAGGAAGAAQKQKTRFQLDVAVVQNLDLQRHSFFSLSGLFFKTDRRASPSLRGSRPAAPRSVTQLRRGTPRSARDSWSTIFRSGSWSRTGSARRRRSRRSQ